MGADGRNRAIEIAILTFASIGAPYVLLQSAGSTLLLLTHGVFQSVFDLQTAINSFIREHNQAEAKPFN